MSTDIVKLEERYRSLEQEIKFLERKRKDEATAAVSIIAGIDESVVEAVSEIVPQIKTIREYTVEDIMTNKNDEVNTINFVYSEVTKCLENMLNDLESRL